MTTIYVVARNYRQVQNYIERKRGEQPEVHWLHVIEARRLQGAQEPEVHLVGEYRLNRYWKEIETELRVRRARTTIISA